MQREPIKSRAHSCLLGYDGLGLRSMSGTSTFCAFSAHFENAQVSLRAWFCRFGSSPRKCSSFHSRACFSVTVVRCLEARFQGERESSRALVSPEVGRKQALSQKRRASHFHVVFVIPRVNGTGTYTSVPVTKVTFPRGLIQRRRRSRTSYV